MTDKLKDIVPISLDKIHPNAWNPNEQGEETFNELVKEIEEDGFDHPCQICPCTCDVIEGEHYVLIGGEHRWKACKVLKYEEVPCVIYKDWDEDAQKIKTMRRNLLTGVTNPQKFTELVKDLTSKGYELDTMHQVFGFRSKRDFERYFIEEKEDRDSSFLDALVEESKREKHAVDSISDIIGSIFADCGDTIDQDYLMFTFKGSTIAVVMCDADLQKLVKKVHDRLSKSGETMTEFMKDSIDDSLEKAY